MLSGVVSSAYDVDIQTFSGGNDEQVQVGVAIVVLVVGLLRSIAVMRRPRTAATILGFGAIVGIVMGAANIDVFGSLLAWGILMGLVAISSYFGARELVPKPTMAHTDSDHSKYCATCGHHLNHGDEFRTNCGAQRKQQESIHGNG